MNVIADRIARKNPFLRDWSNYGIVDIFNPVATAQYQHSVTIPTKPSMMHDFRDLRFFQPDGREIPFWVESGTLGTSALVWFKPYVSSLKNVYIFYGNRDAVSQSNGYNVFSFFDDFEDGDFSDWTDGLLTMAADSTAYSGNLSAKLTYSSGTWPSRYKSLIMSEPFYVYVTARASQTNVRVYIRPEDSGAKGAALCFFEDGNIKYYNNDGSTFTTLQAYSAGTWYRFKYLMKASDWDCWINDVLKATNAVYQTSFLTGNILSLTSNGGSFYVDNVFAREYTATEPVCQLNQSGLRNPEYR